MWQSFFSLRVEPGFPLSIIFSFLSSLALFSFKLFSVLSILDFYFFFFFFFWNIWLSALIFLISCLGDVFLGCKRKIWKNRIWIEWWNCDRDQEWTMIVNYLKWQWFIFWRIIILNICNPLVFCLSLKEFNHISKPFNRLWRTYFLVQFFFLYTIACQIVSSYYFITRKRWYVYVTKVWLKSI